MRRLFLVLFISSFGNSFSTERISWSRQGYFVCPETQSTFSLFVYISSLVLVILVQEQYRRYKILQNKLNDPCIIVNVFVRFISKVVWGCKSWASLEAVKVLVFLKRVISGGALWFCEYYFKMKLRSKNLEVEDEPCC